MVNALKQIRTAVRQLSPDEIRVKAEQRLAIGLVATGSAGYADIEDFLAPPGISHGKRMELMRVLQRAGDRPSLEHFDLVIYEQGLPCPADGFTFYRENPHWTVEEILKEHGDLGISLARLFFPFRKPVVDSIIHSVSRENALFAVATALPNVVPSLIELPWAVGEFASDTAFLTINQIRMAFLIAAASDKEVGYMEQKTEIATIIASAFGWRALARELVGKIPLGGGLIPKGAVAFAGTYVVGRGLERLHHFGYGYSRAERREAYESALERGKTVAETLLSGLKGRTVTSGED